MASRSSHNKNNAGVKRILQEARELATDPNADYHATPLDDDIFEWHCTMRGPVGTEFEGGLYHFRIQLPSEYPFRPPSIMLLTPNGRFELNTKICISFTNYHEELWQPAWGIRTAIIALQGFFPLKGEAAVGVGAVEYPAAERKRLAKLSREWKCPRCERTNIELLADLASPSEQSPQPPQHVLGLDANDNTPPLPNALDPASTRSCDAGHQNHEQPALPIASPPTRGSSSSMHTQPRVTFVPTRPRQAMPFISPESTHSSNPSASRPPLILDGAIAILLTMLVAIICKRIL